MVVHPPPGGRTLALSPMTRSPSRRTLVNVSDHASDDGERDKLAVRVFLSLSHAPFTFRVVCCAPRCVWVYVPSLPTPLPAHGLLCALLRALFTRSQ